MQLSAEDGHQDVKEISHWLSWANRGVIFKLIDREKPHFLNVDDGRGVGKLKCMLLSVQKISEEDYRLCGWPGDVGETR